MIESVHRDGRAGAGDAVATGPYPMGLMSLLATIAMLFAAFTAAILVRRTGLDWYRVTLPGLVWLNTVVLTLSSVLVERARTAVRRGELPTTVRSLGMARTLGGLFLIGQLVAWYVLVQQGVLLPSNPHASFFYMLSAVHGAHVIGGIGALTYTLMRAKGGVYSQDRHRGLVHTAIYWHFVGVVWIYVLALLVTL